MTIFLAWLAAATIARSGAVGIHLPANLLQKPEVHKQLTSGLTTIFVISAAADGVKGNATVEVRYELWEEKYLVTVLDAEGHAQTLTLASEVALAQWWSDNPLIVIPPHKLAQRVDVQVRLKMLPFSSREQRDAQRWLSRTLSASHAPAGEITPAQSEDVLRMIVDASTRRRPLLEYEWSVQATR